MAGQTGHYKKVESGGQNGGVSTELESESEPEPRLEPGYNAQNGVSEWFKNCNSLELNVRLSSFLRRARQFVIIFLQVRILVTC